ncbi:hypothetical protein T492DRAFT_1034732 [Pavlovales sp. CCMP2436]|nr:hypothetical protein T492DRAFT_1034732 [Pavlovales sp. CCMP2436]
MLSRLGGALRAQAAVALRPTRLPTQQLRRGFRMTVSLRTDSPLAADADASGGTPLPSAPAFAEDGALPLAPAVVDDGEMLSGLMRDRLHKSQNEDTIELFARHRASSPQLLEVRHWNYMLTAMENARSSSAEIGAMVAQMRDSGLTPNENSWLPAIRACLNGPAPVGDRDAALGLHAQMKAIDGIEPIADELNAVLMELHVRAGDFDAAKTLQQALMAGQMSRYRAAYTLLMAYAKQNAISEFAAQLAQMRADRQQPRAMDMRMVLKLMVSRRSVEGTMAVMDAMLAVNDAFEPMPPLVLLANAGAFDAKPAEAERLLRACVPLIRTTHYYTKDRLHVLERLLPLLGEPALKIRVINVLAMQGSMNKDVFSAITEMSQTCGIEAADDAFSALEQLLARGERVSVHAVNAVVSMCAQQKDLDRAVEIFQSIEATFSLKPSIGSYNALLLAAKNARQPAALGQIRERLEASAANDSRCRFNRDTYKLLAGHLLQCNDLDGALAMLEEAKLNKQASGGLYVCYIKYYLSTRGAAKARAMVEEARAVDIAISPKIVEEIKRAEATAAGSRSAPPRSAPIVTAGVQD